MPRTNRAAFAVVHRIADEQDGLITAAQARGAGLSAATLCHRARDRGPWQRIHPAVYALHSGPLTSRTLLRAALLYVGEPALITGTEALRAHGLRRALDGGPHLLIPNGRNVTSRPGLLIERTRRFPAAVDLDGLPTVPIERALVDACRRTIRRGEVEAVVSEAVQRRLVDAAALIEEVDAAQIRGTALVRAAAAAAMDGVHSGPEMDLRSVLLAHSMPMPTFNCDLHDELTGMFLARPDAWWRVGVAVEVDSREHHTIGEDFDRTLARDALLTSYGVLTLHVTPRQLRMDPARFVERLRRTLEVAATRPRPAVTASVRGNSN